MKNTISAVNIERLHELFFQLLEGCLEGYDGGQYEIVEIPCGTRYMRFPYKGVKTLEIHDDKAEMSSDASGVAMTLKALTHLYLWCDLNGSSDTGNVIRLFHSLRYYARSHKEGAAILSFIE